MLSELVSGNFCFTVFYLPVPWVPGQLRWVTSKLPDDICVQGNSDAVLHLVKLDLKDWVIEVLPD